MYELLNSSTPS